MNNPTQTVMKALMVANADSGDPRMTFVNLLTAASIAGKIIGLDQREIRRKLKEVERPAENLFRQIAEKADESNRG